MNLKKKRWMVTGAALAMVASLGLSACGGGGSSSGGQAANSETGKNEVTMASRTPNWIFPISAKGYTAGRERPVHPVDVPPALRLQVHL